MEEKMTGTELRANNEQIIYYLTQLRSQRKEITYLVEKQTHEKSQIENEIEKLSFKLTLLIKSLTQRLQAQSNYDRTISEIESKYANLVQESEKLLESITSQVRNLDCIMDKKIGTSVEYDRKEPRPHKLPPIEEPSNEASQKSYTQSNRSDSSSKSSTPETTPSPSAPCTPKMPVEGNKTARIASNELARMSISGSVFAIQPRNDDKDTQNFREAYGRQHDHPRP